MGIKNGVGLMASPARSVISTKSNGVGKLRKEQKGDTDDGSTNGGKEKKGMFGRLVGRKKDKKDRSKTSMSSLNPLSH